MTDFVECDGCSKKLGSPILCSSCAANRRSIADLQKKLAEVQRDYLQAEGDLTNAHNELRLLKATYADEARYRRKWILDQHKAAEAKLAEVEAERDEWQPIETAPKDGTKVILWLPDFHSVEMAWFCVPAEASHWMPLPTPPKGTIDMADHDHMKDA